MITIYKYPIHPSGEEIEIKVPGGGPVFSAGIDPIGNTCVWAIADTEKEDVPVRIYCVGTGWPMDWILEKEDNLECIGTIKEGIYMWHIFVGGPRG
jgi:hypothetical protein